MKCKCILKKVYDFLFGGLSQRGDDSVYFYHCLTVFPRVSPRTLFVFRVEPKRLLLSSSVNSLLSRTLFRCALCCVVTMHRARLEKRHLNLNCWGVYGEWHSGMLMKVSSSCFKLLAEDKGRVPTSSYSRFLIPNADEMRMNGRIAEVL